MAQQARRDHFLLQRTNLVLNMLQRTITLGVNRPACQTGIEKDNSMTMHSTNLGAATAITIRRLWIGDQDLFRTHFDQLDAASRALRFGAAVHGSFIDMYVRSAFANGNMVFGAFVDGELLGVGEIKLLSSKLPLRAEAAFSVVPEWQDKGVGDALFARIIAALQNRGVGSVFLLCGSSNHRMRHLAVKHNAVLTFADGNETRGEVRVPWPMPSSIIEEVYGEAICYTNSLWQNTWLKTTTV